MADDEQKNDGGEVCPVVGNMPFLPGKKGIGRLMRDPESGEDATKHHWEEALPQVLSVNPYWNYTWGLHRIPRQPDHIEFIPMVWWGLKNPERLRKKLEEEVVPFIQSGKVHRLLLFNEPDNVKLANLSVEEALNVWYLFEGIQGLSQIIGPSCTYKNRGPAWMEELMERVEKDGKRMDWVGIHWYGGTDVEAFKREIKEYYDKYGQRPLLLTEFAPANWTAKTCKKNNAYLHRK